MRLRGVAVKPHPFALFDAPLSADKFQELKTSIMNYGQRVPIVILEGTDLIIDGCHRYWAMIELGFPELQMRIDRVIVDEEDLIAYIQSYNGHRRHRDKSRAACAAANAIDHFRERAKERKIFAGTVRGRGQGKVTAPVPESIESREEAAKLFGCSPRYVGMALELKRDHLAVFEQVFRGEIEDLTQALAKAKGRLGREVPTPAPRPPEGVDEQGEADTAPERPEKEREELPESAGRPEKGAAPKPPPRGVAKSFYCSNGGRANDEPDSEILWRLEIFSSDSLRLACPLCAEDLDTPLGLKLHREVSP